jgi:hypothetical protein
MNRRTVLSLMSMLCLVVILATTVPQAGLAQSSPWLGMWKLNLAKSSYLAGQAPKSSTFNFQGVGANLTNTVETITAAGTPIKTLNMHVYDGQPHPLTGSPDVDARSYIRVDGNTVISASTKAGKLVQVANLVLSPDGKTLTVTTRGVDAAGQAVNTVAVYDKQ